MHHWAMLEAIGMGPEEVEIYRAVIERSRSTLRELATATGMTQASARRVLEVLQDKGLVALTPGSPSQFLPTPPDIALEALVTQKQAELDRVRSMAAGLAEQIRARIEVTSPLEVVEVIAGAEAMTRRFDQLQRQATEEICILDKPPYARAGNPLEEELLAAGIKYRAIYDRAGLDLPDHLIHFESFAQLGEEARVISGLPCKLSIFDRTLAFIPLYPVVSGGLVIHPSPLVAALMSWFQLLWERAVPLHLGEKDELATDAAVLTEKDRRLLRLLATGLKDEAIARRLEVTTRTVQRHVRDLMQRLGASNRYQAGLQAARRGWH